MLRRLTAYIDDLGDRVHPIVVLMLRKQKLGMLPMVLITHAVLLFILWSGEQLAHDFGPAMAVFGSTSLSFLLIFPFLLYFGTAVNGYHVVHRSDPLLLLIPLSDRSIWLGFYLTGLYQGFGAWCQVVLTLSYCYALGWVPLEWVLLYPLLSLLAGCVFAAVCMAISVAAKTAVQRGFFFVIWFVPMWCAMMLFIQPPPARSRMLEFLFHSISPSLFEPVCWIPMLVTAVPAYLWTAWKLFNFNLVRRRLFIVKFCVSLSVYSALTAILVGLWFALRFALDGV